MQIVLRKPKTLFHLSVTPQMERDVLLGEDDDVASSNEGASSDNICDRDK